MTSPQLLAITAIDGNTATLTLSLAAKPRVGELIGISNTQGEPFKVLFLIEAVKASRKKDDAGVVITAKKLKGSKAPTLTAEDRFFITDLNSYQRAFLPDIELGEAFKIGSQRFTADPDHPVSPIQWQAIFTSETLASEDLSALTHTMIENLKAGIGVDDIDDEFNDDEAALDDDADTTIAPEEIDSLIGAMASNTTLHDDPRIEDAIDWMNQQNADSSPNDEDALSSFFTEDQVNENPSSDTSWLNWDTISDDLGNTASHQKPSEIPFELPDMTALPSLDETLVTSSVAGEFSAEFTSPEEGQLEALTLNDTLDLTFSISESSTGLSFLEETAPETSPLFDLPAIGISEADIDPPEVLHLSSAQAHALDELSEEAAHLSRSNTESINLDDSWAWDNELPPEISFESALPLELSSSAGVHLENALDSIFANNPTLDELNTPHVLEDPMASLRLQSLESPETIELLSAETHLSPQPLQDFSQPDNDTIYALSGNEDDDEHNSFLKSLEAFQFGQESDTSGHNDSSSLMLNLDTPALEDLSHPSSLGDHESELLSPIEPDWLNAPALSSAQDENDLQALLGQSLQAFDAQPSAADHGELEIEHHDASFDEALTFPSLGAPLSAHEPSELESIAFEPFEIGLEDYIKPKAHTTTEPHHQQNPSAYINAASTGQAAPTEGLPKKLRNKLGDTPYRPGQHISHKHFGNGVITTIAAMVGSSIILDVNFGERGNRLIDATSSLISTTHAHQ